MSSSEVNQMLSMLAWMLVPGMATTLCLRVLYFIRLVRRPTDKAAGARHYRYAFTAVVLAYLIAERSYNQHSSLAASMVGGGVDMDASSSNDNTVSYYARLGVPSGDQFDQRQLKSAFRRLSLKFHPDRNPSADAEVSFQQVRTAYETLNDPMKRRVYDAFGHIDCQHCKTFNEYFYNGLARQSGFYMGFAVFMTLHGLLGAKQDQQNGGGFTMFWRVLGLLALAVFELGRLTGALALPIGMGGTVREQIIVARQLFISLMMAMGQLTPLWYPVLRRWLSGPTNNNNNNNLSTPADQNKAVGAAVQRLALAVDDVAHVMQRQSAITCAAFSDDSAARERIQQRMEKLIVDLQATSSETKDNKRD